MRLKLFICAVMMATLSSSLQAGEDPAKSQILALVKQMTMNEEQFFAFDKKIEKKLIETPFSEQDLAANPQLPQIYEVYRKAIESHRANLRTQYDLGQKMIQQIQETEELPLIGEIVQAFQVAIVPVLEEHKALEAEIKDLEQRIIPLLPPGTQLYY
jgi:hypothetical protein